MYGYIFWIIYERNKLRDKSDWLSRNNASGIVFFALLLHFLLVTQLVETFGNRKILPSALTNNKGVLTLLLLACMVLVFLYFTDDRIKKLRRKYEGKDSILCDNGGFIVALLIFIPLVAILVIGWTG